MHALLCLSDWSWHGLIKNGNIKAAAILPDIIGSDPQLASGWDNIT